MGADPHVFASSHYYEDSRGADHLVASSMPRQVMHHGEQRQYVSGHVMSETWLPKCFEANVDEIVDS